MNLVRPITLLHPRATFGTSLSTIPLLLSGYVWFHFDLFTVKLEQEEKIYILEGQKKTREKHKQENTRCSRTRTSFNISVEFKNMR